MYEDKTKSKQICRSSSWFCGPVSFINPFSPRFLLSIGFILFSLCSMWLSNYMKYINELVALFTDYKLSNIFTSFSNTRKITTRQNMLSQALRIL